MGPFLGPVVLHAGFRWARGCANKLLLDSIESLKLMVCLVPGFWLWTEPITGAIG